MPTSQPATGVVYRVTATCPGEDGEVAVGVVLMHHQQGFVRFVGERDDATMDLDAVPGGLDPLDYRHWARSIRVLAQRRAGQRKRERGTFDGARVGELAVSRVGTSEPMAHSEAPAALERLFHEMTSRDVPEE